MAPKGLKLDQIISLCGEGRDPVSCFKHLNRKYRNRVQFAIQVCRGAASIFPASCALKVPKRFDALQICKGATSDAPATCASFFQRKGKYGLTVEDVNLLCSQATTSGLTECISACPKYLSGSQKVQLCGGSVSAQPASCFVEAILDRKIRSKRRQSSIIDSLIDLCRGAHSSAPALCMQDVVVNKIDFADRISLCKNAQSKEPSNCFNLLKGVVKNHGSIIEFCRSKMGDGNVGRKDVMPLVGAVQCVLSAPSKLTDDEKLQLCMGASSSAPGECIKQAIKTNIPKQYRVALCHGTTSHSGPVNCFSVTMGDINGDQKSELCTMALSEAPARCAQKVVSQHMRPGEKITLCKNAIDDWPAKCANALPRRGVLTETEVAILCNGAKNLEPGQCFLSAPPILSSRQKLTLCSGALVSKHVIKCANSLISILDLDKRVAFCRQAASPLPLQCMSEIPHKWSVDLRTSFCSSIKSRGALLCLANLPPRLRPDLESSLCIDARNGGPGECLRTMPNRYTDNQIVEMCRASKSDMPARCARAAGTRPKIEDVVVACKNAHSKTPGECLDYHTVTSKSLQGSIVSECQASTPIPSEVIVIEGWQTELAYHKRGTKTPLVSKLVAIVHNQYGSQMTEQHLLPKLYANVDRGRELGAELVDLRSVSADKEGRFIFSPISIRSRMGGIFWIRIGGAGIRSTRIPFRLVMQEVYDSCTGLATGCNTVYHSLKSVRDKIQLGGQDDTFVGYITSPKLMMTALACADKLALDRTELHVDYRLPMIWVTMPRRSIGRLKAQIEIPTLDMSPFERLRIKENTTDKKLIRKAYRTRALEWHPDKWNFLSSNNSACANRVSEIFGLIIDAFFRVDEKIPV